jgi:hypothetical protein
MRWSVIGRWHSLNRMWRFGLGMMMWGGLMGTWLVLNVDHFGEPLIGFVLNCIEGKQSQVMYNVISMYCTSTIRTIEMFYLLLVIAE